MKSSNSFKKDKEKENERYTSGDESFTNVNSNNENNNKGKKNIKLLKKINKSYSTLATDINNDRKSSKKTDEDEILEKLQTSFPLHDKIDYAKKIKQAKEVEDLKKIYEKWSGERFANSNKNKDNEEDEEFIWVKKKKAKKEQFQKLNAMNMRYKNILIENIRMKEELKKMQLELNKMSKSKEEKKQKIINLKNNGAKFTKKKQENELEKAKKMIEDVKMKEQLRKLLEEQKNKKNDLIDIIKNKHAKNVKLYGPKVTESDTDINKNWNKIGIPNLFVDKNKNNKDNIKKDNNIVIIKKDNNKGNVKKDNNKDNVKKDNNKDNVKKDNNKDNENNNEIKKNNKIFILDQNKIKSELNKNNKIENIQEKKDDTEEEKEKAKANKLLLEKMNKNQLDMTKKLNEKKNLPENNKIVVPEKKEEKDNNNEQKLKYKLKLNNLKKIIKPYKTNKDLKNLLKQLSSFSNSTDIYNDNFVEQLELILELNKYLQNEITINKNDNLMLPEKAVYFTDNAAIRFLGYFGSELTLRNIKTYIEKKPTNYPLRDITFKLICCGLATQTVYKLIIDNEEYKNSNEAYIKYLEDIKTKISDKFNVSENDIFYFGNNLKNFEIYLTIYKQEIDEVENFLKECNIKVTKMPLLNNVILSSNVFECKYSKDINDWPKNNLMRGGKKYNPPYGWLGIGLKIKNKYGKKNNTWLGKENKEGEWPVGYHGVGIGKGNIFKRILNIFNGNIKDEIGKLFKSEINKEKNNNKYPYCGEGIYFSPNIEDAALFADKTNLGFFNVKFQFAIMARVNSNKIRSPDSLPIQWILSDNNDEIRPYRLLIKFV